MDISENVSAKALTDVTAVAKSQTNRARSVATGVVFGAGQVNQ